jgi:hypothetical protein
MAATPNRRSILLMARVYARQGAAKFGGSPKGTVKLVLARIGKQRPSSTLWPYAAASAPVTSAQMGSLQESDRCVRQAGTDANAAHAASSDGLVLSGRSWPGPGRSPVSQA